MTTQSPKRVLVVEDDCDICALILELLEENGYQAVGVNSGADALARLGSDGRFDLILLDLMMPAVNGFEFRAQQMSDARISSIPVVIMSADGHIHEKMERAHAQDYLKKPLDMDQFLKVVARSVRGS